MTVLTLLAQGGMPGLDQEGPEDLKRLLNLFYVLFGVGVAVAILGYAIPYKLLQIAGIAMIFLSAGVFMAAVGSYG